MVTSPVVYSGCLELHPFPRVFTIVQKNYFDIFFAHFVKKLTPGHPSSGHQVRSKDSISQKKVCNRATATVVETKIWKSQDLVYHLVPTSCISRNSYMIDLRSCSQVSQWGKLKYILHSSDLFKSFSKLTHDFHHIPNPKIPEPFLHVPHRHVARGSNVPRNTGRSGPL